MPIMQPNIPVEVRRELCLDRLIGQAEGRQLHTADDHYLIEQINAAHIRDTAEGSVTACQVAGCALRCLTQNEGGELQLLDSRGKKACS